MPRPRPFTILTSLWHWLIVFALSVTLRYWVWHHPRNLLYSALFPATFIFPFDLFRRRENSSPKTA